MLFLFPDNFLKPRQPDPSYVHEVDAVQSLNQDWKLMSFEALVNEQDVAKAIQRVPPQSTPIRAIYRGWMLKPNQYRLLYDALNARGVRLINSPDEYTYTARGQESSFFLNEKRITTGFCVFQKRSLFPRGVYMHYLPESYPEIKPYTARSVWLPITSNVEFGQIMQTIAVFGDKPVVVKDYVKSQKHYWNEAFFIPDASNREQVERVVTRFMELQGDDLNVGLVFREFISFEQIGSHSKSGMPLTHEYRMFCLDSHILDVTEYWQDGTYDGVLPSAEVFSDVIERLSTIPSPILTGVNANALAQTKAGHRIP